MGEKSGLLAKLGIPITLGIMIGSAMPTHPSQDAEQDSFSNEPPEMIYVDQPILPKYTIKRPFVEFNSTLSQDFFIGDLLEEDQDRENVHAQGETLLEKILQLERKLEKNEAASKVYQELQERRIPEQVEALDPFSRQPNKHTHSSFVGYHQDSAEQQKREALASATMKALFTYLTKAQFPSRFTIEHDPRSPFAGYFKDTHGVRYNLSQHQNETLEGTLFHEAGHVLFYFSGKNRPLNRQEVTLTEACGYASELVFAHALSVSDKKRAEYVKAEAESRIGRRAELYYKGQEDIFMHNEAAALFIAAYQEFEDPVKTLNYLLKLKSLDTLDDSIKVRIKDNKPFFEKMYDKRKTSNRVAKRYAVLMGRLSTHVSLKPEHLQFLGIEAK